nr:unnamed protein product [Haemonchus contortus]
MNHFLRRNEPTDEYGKKYDVLIWKTSHLVLGRIAVGHFQQLLSLGKVGFTCEVITFSPVAQLYENINH